MEAGTSTPRRRNGSTVRRSHSATRDGNGNATIIIRELQLHHQQQQQQQQQHAASNNDNVPYGSATRREEEEEKLGDGELASSDNSTKHQHQQQQQQQQQQRDEDGHTATHGASGAFAFGIGTSEAEHDVPATRVRSSLDSHDFIVDREDMLYNERVIL